MDMTNNSKRSLAIAAAAAVVLGGGGVLLGRTVFAPAASDSAAAPAEAEGAEEEHGPEGFVEMDAPQAQAAGIVTEATQTGGLGAEILAQAMIGATPEGEAILTARADGAITAIRGRLGDYVRAGESVATIESRDAAAIASERSTANARLALARSVYQREQRLFDARVTARQDLEGAQAALREAESEAQRAQSAFAASGVTGNGRALTVVSLISGRITSSEAHLGAYVTAGTELFRVADPNRVQIEASVLPADARRIQPGARATLELIGGETRNATVRSVTPSVDAESRTATVVLIPEGTSGLTPGQGLRVRIRPSAAATSGTISLPEEAVQSFEGRDVVFVRNARGFQAVNVTTGQRGGGRIEIIDGLRAGMTVATRGAFLLKSELGASEAEH